MDAEYESGLGFGQSLHARLQADDGVQFANDFRAAYTDAPVKMPKKLETPSEFASQVKYLQVMGYPDDLGTTFIDGVIEGVKGTVASVVSTRIGPNIADDDDDDHTATAASSSSSTSDDPGFSSSSSSSSLPSSSVTTDKGDYISNVVDRINSYTSADPAYLRHLENKFVKSNTVFNEHVNDKVYQLFSRYCGLLRLHTISFIETIWDTSYVEMSKYPKYRDAFNELFNGINDGHLEINTKEMSLHFHAFLKTVVNTIPEIHTVSIHIEREFDALADITRFICALLPNLRHLDITFAFSGMKDVAAVRDFADFISHYTDELATSVHLSKQLTSLEITFNTKKHTAFYSKHRRIISDKLFTFQSPEQPFPAITMLTLRHEHSLTNAVPFFENVFRGASSSTWTLKNIDTDASIEEILASRVMEGLGPRLQHLTLKGGMLNPQFRDLYAASSLVTLRVQELNEASVRGIAGETPTFFQEFVAATPPSITMLEFTLRMRNQTPFDDELAPVLPADNNIRRFSCTKVYSSVELFPSVSKQALRQLKRFVPTNVPLIMRLFDALDRQIEPARRRFISASRSHMPSPAKAREMLAHPPHHRALTSKQRHFFEARAHGWVPS